MNKSIDLSAVVCYQNQPDTWKRWGVSFDSSGSIKNSDIVLVKCDLRYQSDSLSLSGHNVFQ